MCGRYKLDKMWREIWSAYQLTLEDKEKERSNSLNTEARFNIAPTVQVPVIRLGERGREAVSMRWGLVPTWAKDLKGPVNNNARAEGITEKPSFKRAFAKRRCLIPADGFYEWETLGKTKLPWLFEIDGGVIFSFAGIWEAWKQPDGEMLESFSIITCAPNATLAKIHDRMPVILPADNYTAWLSPDTSTEDAQAMLKAYPDAHMSARRVSTRLNNSRNQGADLLIAD